MGNQSLWVKVIFWQVWLSFWGSIIIVYAFDRSLQLIDWFMSFLFGSCITFEESYLTIKYDKIFQ